MGKPEEPAELAVNGSVCANDASVQSYLGMLQDAVSRMARNSASCKQWCLTLTAALMALGFRDQNYDIIRLAVMPVVILCLLDGFYLSLEVRFREVFDDFVAKLQAGSAVVTDLFRMNPPKPTFRRRAFKSVSLLPFYGLLLAAVLMTYLLANSGQGSTSSPPEQLRAPAGATPEKSEQK